MKLTQLQINSARSLPQYDAGHYGIDGVLYYHGKDFDAADWRPRDREQCLEMGWPWEGKQKDAYDQSTREVIEAYRKAHIGYTPSPEEQFEMRAAFGPNIDVVDIITGQKFRT